MKSSNIIQWQSCIELIIFYDTGLRHHVFVTNKLEYLIDTLLHIGNTYADKMTFTACPCILLYKYIPEITDCDCVVLKRVFESIGTKTGSRHSKIGECIYVNRMGTCNRFYRCIWPAYSASCEPPTAVGAASLHHRSAEQILMLL